MKSSAGNIDRQAYGSNNYTLALAQRVSSIFQKGGLAPTYSNVGQWHFA